MQCKSCGTILPMGITTCPTCGAPAPFAHQGTPQTGMASPSDATVASTSPYGVEPSAPANPYSYNQGTQNASTPSDPYSVPQQDFNGQSAANPYTNFAYGAQGTQSSPNTQGEQASANPYEQSNSPYNISLPSSTGTPSNPYETTMQVPPPPPPSMRAQSQPSPASFPPQAFAQAPQYQHQPRSFQQQAQASQAPFQPRSAPLAVPGRLGSSNALKLGIFLLILILLGVGFIALARHGSSSGNGSGTNVTATSGTPVDQNAASFITNARTASKESNTAPNETTFGVNKPIYALFNPKLNGSTGYAIAKWYGNGQLLTTTDVLALNPDYQYQYFINKYDAPTNGNVEIYWCTHADCSDAKLASTNQFTVAGDGGKSKKDQGGGDTVN